jgi:hypothetical protein
LVLDQQPPHCENAVRLWKPSGQEAIISATPPWQVLDISARINSMRVPPLAEIALRGVTICLQANPTDSKLN